MGWSAIIKATVWAKSSVGAQTQATGRINAHIEFLWPGVGCGQAANRKSGNKAQALDSYIYIYIYIQRSNSQESKASLWEKKSVKWDWVREKPSVNIAQVDNIWLWLLASRVGISGCWQISSLSHGLRLTVSQFEEFLKIKWHHHHQWPTRAFEACERHFWLGFIVLAVDCAERHH